MAIDKNMRILVVDDFATMRRIIIGVLKDLGLKNVVEADDGDTAWDVLQKDDIDLIISDWNMPRMKGVDLLVKVRGDAEHKDTPFIMVTAEAQKENILEAVKKGVSNYVVKPFNAPTPGEKIQQVFG